MNVLFLTSRCPFDEVTGPMAAGAEIATRRIAETLAARDHHVHYVSLDDGPQRTVRLNGVTIHIYPRDAAGRNRARGLSRLAAALGRPSRPALRRLVVSLEHRFWGFKKQLQEVIEAHDIRLIHSYSSLPDALAAALAASEMRIPLVVRMGGRYWYRKYLRIPKQAKQARYLDHVRFVFDTATCLAFNSSVLEQGTEAMFRELGITAPARRVVIDIGVAPPPDVEAAPDPVRLAAGENGLVAACIGKFKPDSKRQDVLIEAAELLRDEIPLRVYFAGGGSGREQLEQLARDRGVADRMVFLGDIPHASVFRLIDRSDVVVHPTEFEGSSKAIAEAMLCGRPIVASDIPAIREHVSDGTTGLLAANTAESFAEKLRHLYRSPDERERLGAAARAYAQRSFDPEANVVAYEELFCGLIAGADAS